MPPRSFAAMARRREAHKKAQEKAKRLYAEHLREQQQPHHGSNALGPRGGKKTRKSRKNHNKKTRKTRKNKRKSSRRRH